jgi:nitronate monooxygenase
VDLHVHVDVDVDVDVDVNEPQPSPAQPPIHPGKSHFNNRFIDFPAFAATQHATTGKLPRQLARRPNVIRTRLTELCGIEHPVVGGAMAHLSDALLVGAISEAGGLGVLASANYKTADEFRAELKKIREVTAKPYAVNLNLFPMMRPIDNMEYLDVLCDEGCTVVETSGHELPEELTGTLKARGLVWIHKCVLPRHAQRAERMGADAVTVVGYENGGATGRWDIGTMVLVPAVIEAVDIPVIGGGGVVDGRGLAALLALGASGVIMGSRFVLAQECNVHENVRKLLCDASITDTMLVMRAIGATHRVIANQAARDLAEVEASPDAGLEDILPFVLGEKSREVYFDGNVDAGMCYISQAVGLMPTVKTAASIVHDTVAEAEAILKRLSPG